MDCCFNPLNTRGVYISSSEMLLSNQGRMMSCATLSVQPANLKEQFRYQRYTCNPSFVFEKQPLRLPETNF